MQNVSFANVSFTPFCQDVEKCLKSIPEVEAQLPDITILSHSPTAHTLSPTRDPYVFRLEKAI